MSQLTSINATDTSILSACATRYCCTFNQWQETPGSAECLRFLSIAMVTVSEAGARDMNGMGCRGLGQLTTMESILTLNGSFLDNI